MKLIFASNNANKIMEIQSLIGNTFELISLKQANINIDIPEPHDTLKANASEKSWTIYNLTSIDCFSEDTGLEVDYLNGSPGVKSARYAGEPSNSEKNIEKLLFNLTNCEHRTARFRTIISLIINKQEFFFEGICEGSIEKKCRGSEGFGYDAVFCPLNSAKTFGEMNMAEKSLFSHRKNAVKQLVSFLHSKMNIY